MAEERSNPISPVAVNQCLAEWRAGDQSAYNRLIELLHDDLHRIAHRQFGRERVNHTLQTGDLVSKLYLKLLGSSQTEWRDHAHFLNAAARTMRQILIDHARVWMRRADGKGRQELEERDLGAMGFQSTKYMEKLLLLDQVIANLENMDANLAKIADMKIILGLTLKEISEQLNMDLSRVKREWSLIKIFLSKKLGGSGK